MNIENLLNLDLGFITNIRGPQLLIIALVILLLFGSKRLPDLARSFGKAIREFRKSASDVEKNFKAAMDESTPPSPPSEAINTENKTQA